MNTLIPGLIGIGLLVTFLGTMLGKVAAIPLIIIAILVVGFLVFDFYQELKAERAARK
jgi:hypothetical protein